MTTRPIATTLVSLETADGWTLDALHYRDPRLDSVPPSDRVAVVHLHGKGGNMTSGMSRYLPELLPGVEHLSVNMRCHDLATYSGRGDVPAGGGMFESLRDGHHDVHAAVRYLRDAGIGTVVLAGFSSGGWYVGDYSARHHDVDARFLLSPLTDNKTRLAWWFPDGDGIAERTELAEALVAAGRPHELIPVPSDYWAISADAWLQRVGEEDGTWLTALRADDTPVLLVWGTEESRAELWRELYDSFPGARSRAAVEGAEHDFVGFETEVAGLVSEWLWDVCAVDAGAPGTARTALHFG
ncbi:alpha/beta hydrolase [Marisediminicola sp. LYQ134]|uniref:alpha/beta hydrolase n=1 Tax=unclassified Marisediminicola TaxID=2618316 RepID=UPI003982DE4D